MVMREADFIEPSTMETTTKMDDGVRISLDSRKVNRVTHVDVEPVQTRWCIC